MPQQLSLWFLLLSLFLPRASLFLAYFFDDLTIYNLNGWIPPFLAISFPRALVLILIFQDRGMSLWLVVHAMAMVSVYSWGPKIVDSRNVRPSESADDQPAIQLDAGTIEDPDEHAVDDSTGKA